jgi:acyl-CoA dehydrogenase
MSRGWDEPFGLDDDHRAFQESVRQFARDVVKPVADEIDRLDAFPQGVIDAFADAGLIQLVVPGEWGGSDGDLRAVCIAKEEVSRAGSSALAMLCGQNTTLTKPLLRFGTDEQKAEMLPELAKGAIVSLCITEPDAGSHPMEMRTRATRAEGGWVLQGQKALISWGEVARYAVILAKTADENGDDAISAFITETTAEGYHVTRHNKKHGQRGIPNVDVSIDKLFVPDEHVLGPIGEGLKTGLGMLHVNRPTMGALAIGTGQAALDAAIDFLSSRSQNGKPLTAHQGLRWMIADMATDLASARALLYECARQIDEGAPVEEISTLASMVKLRATEVGVSVANSALQLFGGGGYLGDYPVERYVRDARVGTLYEGTSQIQRNTIARGVLAEAAARTGRA